MGKVQARPTRVDQDEETDTEEPSPDEAETWKVEAIEAAIDEQDFDESTNFAPEVESQLRQFVLDRPRGKPVDDLMNELGLNE